MEIEYGGIKASGGKLFIIISLLGTLGGALWGGFEFYKDYQDMKAQITSYVAPDLSGVDKKLEVLDIEVTTTKELISTEISSIKDIVDEAQDTTRDIRTTMKTDINLFSDQIAAIDKRSREDGLETRTAMRNAENEVRQLIADTSKRWDDKLQKVDNKLQKVDNQIEMLETKLDKKITKALENPLAAMSKTK
jgi:predicted  nucleic acid-binding Zn-ribbon protein|tara:strand:- start:1481 stop:2056 length:576 start_codon:yes stop_codon:yes gene_type:complete